MHDDLLVQVGAVADAVGAADLAAPVTPCPGWSVLDLARHLGRVHRRVTVTVSQGLERFPRPDAEIADGEPPSTAAGVADWLRAGGDALVAAFRTAGPEASVAGFRGPVPVSFWVRRQLHETLVHRYDAEDAAGVAPWVGVSPELAADGIGEYYEIVSRFRTHHPPATAEQTVHVHATDVPTCEWFVRRRAEGVTITQEHGRADAAVRGPALGLYAAITNRRGLDAVTGPLGAVEVLGDRAVLEDWLAASAL